MLAIVAVTAGLGSAAQWHERYADWKVVATSGIGNFVEGAGHIVQPIVMGDAELARTIVAVIVISFAATTLDTAARIQRFCLGELGGAFGVPALENRYLGSAIAVLPAAALAVFTDGGKGLGSGGFILWPLFGTTNQLVGGLTLLVLIVHLKTRKRPVWPVAIPMVFLVLMTTTAGVMNLHGQLTAGTKNWPVIVFGVLFLLLEVLIFVEAIKTLRRMVPARG